jgi:hypothetical protein
MATYDFDNQTVVASLALSETSTLQVSLVRTSDGGTAIGFREWVHGGAGAYSGPTKKGLLLSAEHLGSQS